LLAGDANAAPPAAGADEAAIRYNAGDAKAVAALYAEDAPKVKQGFHRHPALRATKPAYRSL